MTDQKTNVVVLVRRLLAQWVAEASPDGKRPYDFRIQWRVVLVRP
jgi:hypothetical protein